MKRQAMNVSPKELRGLADCLEKEGKELVEKIGDSKAYDETKQWSVPIINKEGLSDTWRFENE